MAARSISQQSPAGNSDTPKTPAKKQTRMERFKPHLPYEDYPLFPHQSGRWAKKINKKLFYYGKVSEGWEAGLKAYEQYRDYDRTGRSRPLVDDNACTIKELCNRFLTVKQNAVNAGELSEGQFKQYYYVCEKIIEVFGKQRRVDDLSPDDFGRLKTWMANKGYKPSTMRNQINQIKSVFKFAYDELLIDRPVRYGQQFKRPSAKHVAVAKAANGRHDFTQAEIKKLLSKASGQMRAIVLLGVNAGYINVDVSRLNRSDIKNNVIDIPVRVKTGMARQCPLWPETVNAIKSIESIRPDSLDPLDADAVFIAPSGKRWTKDYLCHEFRKLCEAAKVYVEGRGLANLRLVFRTVAGGAGDTEATDLIMGHRPGKGSAAVNYIGKIDTARLRKVVNHVRQWLFGKGVKRGRTRRS